ncbi:VOC family protein [Psychromicrobium sp. YIM B11713]|uniref:VOC family protein n=1 Tax=Psychromicrobium sp. YIM B11713 TaxID=3145233 RepID=UPI00374E2205
MDQRITFVTLAVADLTATKEFYLAALGWEASYQDETVLMLQVAPGVMLSFWDVTEFEAEVGPVKLGQAPLTLAHNCRSAQAVDSVLRTAVNAGGTLLVPGTARAWGGYSGYFSDPTGYRWEIAWNPSPLGERLLDEADAAAQL